MILPIEFEDKMKNLLKDEYEEFIKSFDNERFYGLRLNTLKINSKAFKNKTNFNLSPIAWCKDAFYYKKDDKPAKHPYYHAGLYYIQEPSAMAPAEILDVKPGDKVLDLCAAPGGKSTQLGAKLKGKGLLFSNDISASRCKALLKNIEMAGIKNIIITNESPERLSEYLEGYFDKILVDAPCSGEGMFRKEPETIKSWRKDRVKFFCDLQRNILNYAAKMLKPGGHILYSTCTFSPEENEGTIEEFLSKNNDFEIIPIANNNFSCGMPDWIGARKEIEGTARLWPHKLKGEGHFLALLYKKETNHVKIKVENKYFETNKVDLSDFYKFVDVNIKGELAEKIGVHGNSILLLPEEIPNLKGLRIVRTGWLLGFLKKNRFEPSQAMAMGLNKNQIVNIIDLSLEDPNVIRYLKGETISIKGKEGWNLVCVDGYPLGWGKIQNNKLKNKYSVGWRWM
ncbi:MAG: NOL1/NOP2/sun family putative RNA methylase [Epulopiscium sp.]|jgi:NOL1/NOP2/sun family putative RNA methylase|nr:NOL1/NOP2/sun family putative RNA methylase [Candidatus Epulonipiscium sp.]